MKVLREYLASLSTEDDPERAVLIDSYVVGAIKGALRDDEEAGGIIIILSAVFAAGRDSARTHPNTDFGGPFEAGPAPNTSPTTKHIPSPN